MRIGEITQKTSETEIRVKLNLDGSGQRTICTGIGFLDHMLGSLAFHGLFDLELEAAGDLEVDSHHTVEDCALALGRALDRALGDRRGISRIGSATIPMDEALARVVVDLSGRPYAVVKADWHGPVVGAVPTSLFTHFFESLAVTARCNLHAQVLYGRDDHHQAEALYKGLGRALEVAVRLDPRRQGGIPSTKGVL